MIFGLSYIPSILLLQGGGSTKAIGHRRSYKFISRCATHLAGELR